MQILASVHVAPLYTVPEALLLAAAVLWYWWRLGRRDVPVSRRRIRRASLSLVLVTIPVFVGALSFVDPQQRASTYIVLWSVGMLCVLLIMVTAVVDALNNIRLHREAAHVEAIAATVQIIESLKRNSQDEQPDRDGADE
jgi:hypothetical protein